MHELPKVYEPHNYEDEIYKKWEESGLFNPDVCVAKGFTKSDAEPFSIVLPPPNVTGTLHMGHAAMLAIEDVMVRYHRMKGDKTLWVPGTDHAAIATQSKVEKLVMEAEGKSKYDLGRAEFLKRVEKFAQESHDTIVNQCKKMGASLDWSREAYTLDEKRNLAVRTVFKKMYDDGLIYRGYRVINWSVKGQSTCSDDELVHIERPAKLYYFKYSKDFPITIATTRPETKLGDTAVAVNPKDKRYKKYIGKEFIVDVGAAEPLKIKIIGEDSVESEFGTGALGVTPAHSPIDFEMYQKQKATGNDVGLIQVIGEDGKMTNAAGKDYAGLTVLEARAKFVEYLRNNNLLEKEEDITQNVGTSDRFGDVVEPLPKLQWFIDVNKTIKERDGKTLKELMQDVVKSKKVEIIPDRFEKTYFNWIDNLRDWCISRQIWYGHRIPVWYCMACGMPRVAEKPKGKWFFVRHGETDWNKEKKMQGQADIPLNEKGREQAREATKMFVNQPIDVIFTSDLLRARETAEILAEATGAEVVIDVRFRERHYGQAEGMDREAALAAYPDLFQYNGTSAENESYQAAEERIWTAVSEHLVKHRHKNILVVTHGSILRTFLRRIKNVDPDSLSTIPLISNAQALQLDILEESCEDCGGHFFEQDSDTLDTWFSSGLWTFSTLGWPDEKSQDFKNYHPTSVLETGYDILFFWVARMILMTTYTLGEVPFKTVYLHGLVRDEQGRKMSKSLDNIINPLDMIAKYGTDATRLSLLLGNTPGNDMKLSEEKIAGFRNFTNKLWNISRFILLNIPEPKMDIKEPEAKTLFDEWVLGLLNNTAVETSELIKGNNFSMAGEKLREFSWGALADCYLEVAKIEGGKSEILNYIFNALVKLWHPFMPFVTEAIWQEVYKGHSLLMTEKYPEYNFNESVMVINDLVSFILSVNSGIRSLRAEKNIEPSKKINVFIKANSGNLVLLRANSEIIKQSRTGIDNLQIEENFEKETSWALAFVSNGVEVYIDMAGAVDNEKEKPRLEKEIAEIKKYVSGLENKLSNQEFVSNAPPAVVEKEKAKLSEAQGKLEKLEEQLNILIQ